MDTLEQIWGRGDELNSLQMSVRGLAIFFIAVIILRISGRRSFGVGTPLDNAIVILLGAILSRSVTGASPFLPVVVTCLLIASLHRFFSWYKVRHPRFEAMAEGEKILLFENNAFIEVNMSRALVSREDILQTLRQAQLPAALEPIDKLYMERNGSISILLKPVLKPRT
ncbi:MAG: DUF421 domain-containing protein [Chitinophagaceae bacterium]|nr:MAG: DUF421 domain-containing protein [Chitinophagaceae bacterium]